jgi:guanylate kinase
MRAGEQGDEYVFCDRASFERAIAEGRFLEWAEYHGNLYGTPLPEPRPDQAVLLEIELQGARQVVEHEPSALVILLEPPSLDELAARLKGRGDSDEHIELRLSATPEELAQGRDLAHHVVVNDDLEAVVEHILSILDKPRPPAGNQGDPR